VAVAGLLAMTVDGLADMAVDGLAVVTVRRRGPIGFLATSPLGNRRRGDGALGSSHGVCSHCHMTEVPLLVGSAVSSPMASPATAQAPRKPVPNAGPDRHPAKTHRPLPTA
jgi:hypothetical protein